MAWQSRVCRDVEQSQARWLLGAASRGPLGRGGSSVSKLPGLVAPAVYFILMVLPIAL